LSAVLIRVDNRLVHGQILETWVNHTNANSIIVFNDDLFDNQLQKDIIHAFVPSYIEVIIKKLDDMPQLLDYLNSTNTRSIVLFFNIHDALYAYKNGLAFSKLNLGNIHCQPNRRQVTQTIYLNDEDIEELKLLEGMGVQIEIKTVPQERGIKKIYKDFKCL
jgi:PTS system mannose-specific IIB component